MPVLWEASSAPLTASLIFGVGVRHETYRTLQVTHLIEHLVMGTLPKSALDHNAWVDMNRTSFFATGEAGSVVEFIHRVCAALSDLPLDRLEHEARVLEAEDSRGEHPALAVALNIRYGNKGMGLASLDGPGARTLTRDHVRKHLRRYFTRANCVLVLTGEPPTSLRLSLPDGQVCRPSEEDTPVTELPACLNLGADFPTLSFAVGSGGLSDAVLPFILTERLMDDLRHGRGIAYDINWIRAMVSPTRSVFALISDAHEQHDETVASAMWNGLEDLAKRGPRADELRHALDVRRTVLEDPRSVADRLEVEAGRLLDQRPLIEVAQFLDTLPTADDVQQLAREGCSTAVLQLPYGVDTEAFPLRDVTDVEPTCPPYGDRIFTRRAASFAPRGLTVRIGDDGISVTLRGSTFGGRWDEVVAVARSTDFREVMLANGMTFTVPPRQLRRGDELVALLDSYTANVAFESIEDDLRDGLMH